MNKRISAIFSVIGILALAFTTSLTQSSIVTAAPSPAISLTGGLYTQDFDSLANSGTSSTLPVDWYLSESGTNADTLYTAGTGSSNAGDTYSYGAASATDRALGMLQSGSLIPLVGAQFTNNTGGTILSLDIKYTGEQWRLGTASRTDQIDFQLSTDAASLTTGTWVDYNSLDFITPNTTTTGAKDGNAAANQTAVSGAISGLNIADGATFWIRWVDFNASGADDGLAVDDFSLLPVVLSSRLFGTTANGGTGGTSTLVELDPVTGALINTVGPVGYLVNGLDYDPVSGKLYATTSANDPVFKNGLLTIDMTSGAGTPIGSGNYPTYSSVNNIRADPSGTLFAFDGGSTLLTVDPITGVATSVGSLGVTMYRSGGSFDAGGTFYFINDDSFGSTSYIYTVDTSTGATTSTGNSFSGLAHHGDFHPDTGLYWGIDAGGAGTKNINVVDVSTGTIDASLPSVDNLHTLAFVVGFTPSSDTTPPVVSVPSDITAEATSASGAVVNFSVSATDETSPANPAVTCDWNSGDTFPLGTTSVTCSADDDAGNTGYGYFDVTVQDTTDPSVTVPADMTVQATSAAGADVTFSASASDAVGVQSFSCYPPSGSTFPLGITNVSCLAADAEGNVGSDAFSITVEDTTAPSLNLPANITVPQTIPAGAVVNFVVTATDLVDASPIVVCTPASGSTFPLGTTTVNCSATDTSGNTAYGSHCDGWPQLAQETDLRQRHRLPHSVAGVRRKTPVCLCAGLHLLPESELLGVLPSWQPFRHAAGSALRSGR